MKKFLKKLIPTTFLQFWRKIRYKKSKSIFSHKEIPEVFQEVYKSNHWKSDESVSGTGSEDIQTQNIVIEISMLIKEFNIKSILDIPCGDFLWMEKVDKNGTHYLGCDIVEDIVQANKKFENETVYFKKLNLINDILPKSDLIINRDCLVHLSYRDIKKSLDNILSTDCKYLLSTTFPKHKVNFDIATGDWRPINLEKAPFNLPPPLKIINEGCTEGDGEFADKSMALWELSSLKKEYYNLL